MKGFPTLPRRHLRLRRQLNPCKKGASFARPDPFDSPSFLGSLRTGFDGGLSLHRTFPLI